MDNEQTDKQIEDKIFSLENTRIILSISPALFDRLNSQAEFQKLSIEEHCEQVLRTSLEKGVGAAMITAPSQMSGSDDIKKVTGPTFSVTRVG